MTKRSDIELLAAVLISRGRHNSEHDQTRAGELLRELCGKLAKYEDKELRGISIVKNAFLEGYDLAGSLTPHAHEVLREKHRAWRRSKSRAALEAKP